jgi:cell wall-associated NlpC family hydrolase
MGKPSQGSGGYNHDDFRESQVLYNEILLPMSRRSGWFHVEAREQKRYVPGIGWTGYYGWVAAGTVVPVRTIPEYDLTVKVPLAPLFVEPSMDRRPITLLSMGTRLAATGDSSEDRKYLGVRLARGGVGWIELARVHSRRFTGDSDLLRRSIAATALKFQGLPYLWGGRSMHVPEAAFNVQLPVPLSPSVATGVDCSGLMNLVFGAHGMDIPRNAHDQWLWADPLEPRQCLLGDLFFLTEEGDPQTVAHVMLSMGGEEFIEAAETGGTVRCVTFQEKFGLTRQAMGQAGWEVAGRKIYCGSIVVRNGA